MLGAGRAPSTLKYCFATIRQVWNMAKRDGIVTTESPTKEVKIPKIDNKRLRFLTYDESNILLKELAMLSTQLHDMALLSLHCGLRAGEIFSLEWNDIDFENDLLTLRDTKSGRTRVAYMTEAVKNMLANRKHFAENALIFPDRNGKKIKRISNSFARAVDVVGLNNGITDKRHKVVFHTLRHTFASWHVQSGTDLYTLQTLMGHQSFSMVTRYAHLSEGTLQKAVKNLEESMSAKKDVIELRKKAT
jgi:integrase